MTDQNAPAPLADGRVSTGNAGLDAMLEGGLVARRPYIVVGPSGTGKTTLALQFLCEGIRRGERALLVTLEEPPNEARINHRGFEPELDRVDVFDAIPDIMRYERVPFKDIASVRSSQPFSTVDLVIRRSPELSAVEVTMAALEQMLRTEVIRKGYSRIAIDSLTALQYFCMKGFDPVAGAQSFVRFLSDLRVTTILTVESPLEDVDTPERALARGEIRLFRWELENRTVRAIGVEKFRGSPHDVRLHPYRIGPKGIGIDLETTISRDTRQIIEAGRPVTPMPAPTPIPLEEVVSPVDSLAEEVRDLVLVGAEIGPVRTEIEAALGAAAAGEVDRSRGHISRATALALGLSDALDPSMADPREHPPEVGEAYQRINQRAEAARAGLPPTRLPPPKVLEVQLEWVLSLLPPPVVPAEPEPAPETVPEATPPIPVPVEAPILHVPPEAPSTPPVRAAVDKLPPRIEPQPNLPPEPLSHPEPPPTLTPAPVAEPAAPISAESRSLTPSAAVPLPSEVVSHVPDVVPPPALPTGRRGSARGATPAALGLPETSRPARTGERAVRNEARPPLPQARTRISPHEKAPIPREAHRPPTAPPARAAAFEHSPPESVVAPMAPPGPVAVPEPPATTTPAPPKRRRRASTAARRKSPPAEARVELQPSVPSSPVPLSGPATAGGPELPVEPVAAAPEMQVTASAPTTKPKKRTARKRKAPPVVAATAGAILAPAPDEPREPAPPAEPAPPQKEGE